MIEIKDKCPICVRERGEAKTREVTLHSDQVLVPDLHYPATFVCPEFSIKHGTWTRTIVVKS